MRCERVRTSSPCRPLAATANVIRTHVETGDRIRSTPHHAHSSNWCWRVALKYVHSNTHTHMLVRHVVVVGVFSHFCIMARSWRVYADYYETIICFFVFIFDVVCVWMSSLMVAFAFIFVAIEKSKKNARGKRQEETRWSLYRQIIPIKLIARESTFKYSPYSRSYLGIFLWIYCVCCRALKIANVFDVFAVNGVIEWVRQHMATEQALGMCVCVVCRNTRRFGAPTENENRFDDGQTKGNFWTKSDPKPKSHWIEIQHIRFHELAKWTKYNIAQSTSLISSNCFGMLRIICAYNSIEQWTSCFNILISDKIRNKSSFP